MLQEIFVASNKTMPSACFRISLTTANQEVEFDFLICRYKYLLFCKYVDQTKFLRNFVCHNEPRYAYPAAYKTTDDLLHLC